MRDGAPVLVTGPVLIKAPALVTARYDNGFWVETLQGSYRNSSRLVYPDANASVICIMPARERSRNASERFLYPRTSIIRSISAIKSSSTVIVTRCIKAPIAA